MGQTHVALMDGVAAGAGLPRLSGAVAALATTAGVPLESCLGGLG